MRERKRANAMFLLSWFGKKKRDVLLASCSQLLRLKSIKKNYIRIFQYGSRTGGCPTIRYQQVSWLTHPPALERGMIRFIGNPSKKTESGVWFIQNSHRGESLFTVTERKAKGRPITIGLVVHVEIKLCVDTSHSALVSNVFGKKMADGPSPVTSQEKKKVAEIFCSTQLSSTVSLDKRKNVIKKHFVANLLPSREAAGHVSIGPEMLARYY